MSYNIELNSASKNKRKESDTLIKLLRNQVGDESNEETPIVMMEKIKNLDNWFKQFVKIDQDEYLKFKKKSK